MFAEKAEFNKPLNNGGCLDQTHLRLLQRLVSDDYCKCSMEDMKDCILSDLFKLFISHVLDPWTFSGSLDFYKRKHICCYKTVYVYTHTHTRTYGFFFFFALFNCFVLCFAHLAKKSLHLNSAIICSWSQF